MHAKTHWIKPNNYDGSLHLFCSPPTLSSLSHPLSLSLSHCSSIITNSLLPHKETTLYIETGQTLTTVPTLSSLPDIHRELKSECTTLPLLVRKNVQVSVGNANSPLSINIHSSFHHKPNIHCTQRAQNTISVDQDQQIDLKSSISAI